MRKVRHFLLTAAAVLCSTLTTWAAYNGTPAEPTQINGNYANYGLTSDYNKYYVISTAEELYGFAELVNGGSRFAKGVLTADIVINENVLTAEGELNGTPTYEWTPIGNSSYYGAFDGNGHTIKGLYIDSNDDYVGLFSYINGGTDEWSAINNVGIIDSYIKGGANVGSICGYIDKRLKITNCYNTGTITGTSNVGGICGKSNGWSTIINCYNTGSVTGGSGNVGGISGSSSQSITNCYNIGTVKGSSTSVGSICGYPNSGKPTNCYYLVGCAKDGNNVEQFGIGSWNLGSTTADVEGKTTSTTTEEFASGKIAYLLNSGENTAWRQNLESNKDNFPTLDNSHGMVYVSSPCPIRISNHSDPQEHDMENGICKVCGECENIDGVYQLGNADQLYWFAAWVNDGHTDANAVMIADIVVNTNVLSTDGTLNGTPDRTWTPIGTNGNKYAGTFDGLGHTISGLYFDAGDAFISHVGLFGYCNTTATISNVGITDSYIKGHQYIGGISGTNGTIINCYNTGTINGSEEVGGICGSGGTQTNCYNTGVVKGRNTYNNGNVGGICGYGGTQTNCYYLAGCAKDGKNVEQYGVGNSTIGSTTPDMEGRTAQTTAEEFASGKITYLLNGSTSTGDLAWYQTIGEDGDKLPSLDNGHNKVYATSPCPRFSNDPSSSNNVPHEFKDGKCKHCGEYETPTTTADGTYQLANANNLYWFALQVNSGQKTINAVLTADIVINTEVLNTDGTLNGTPDRAWTPIGTEGNKYAGAFDGNGHTISGLYINTNAYAGLFGCCDVTAIISNVGIIDSYINGSQYVGGVCGYNHGTITNCYNAGTVTGGYYQEVGGICGYSNYGTITNCHNTGTVSASNEVGGICGYGYYETITNCYNSGTVTGTNSTNSWAGGICGFSLNGTQTNCYNTGTITGSGQAVGGICGEQGSQTNCYNTGTVKGAKSVGGICGGIGVQINCYYLAGCAKDGNNVEQYGRGNITQGQTTADDTGTQSATVNEFESGKIAFKLNGSTSDGDLAWYQTIGDGGDVLPTWDNSHGRVYVSSPCPVSYSNSPDASANHTFENGQCKHCGECESINGVYQLANANQLYWFAAQVNSGRTTINAALTADIVVNENVLTAEGELNGSNFRTWEPIGTGTHYYNGTFNGNGHTISGLYLNGATVVGLFGYCANSAEIKNVGIIDSYIRGNAYVGSICGCINGSTITNCYNTGTVIGASTYPYYGGICGYNYSGKITNCYNTGKITGYGSICGENYGRVTNCWCLTGCSTNAGGGTFATAAEFASGKIAYLLNDSNFNGITWRQTLLADELPILDATHNAVTGYLDEVENVVTAYGNVVLTTNYTIAEGKTLNIPAGATLTTTGEAIITNNGTLVCNGTIAGNDLAGDGSFYYTLLVDADVTLNTASYTYKGTAYEIGNGLDITYTTHTILGKEFTFSPVATTITYAANTNAGAANAATVTWNSTISRTFTINQKDVELVWENTELTYNGSAQKPTATATGMVNDESLVVTVLGEQTNASTDPYTATASISDNNYSLPDVVTIEFTIGKATPIFTAPENLSVKCNETLSDITLPAGFTFENVNAELTEGENTLTVKFTPEDTDNYKVVEGIEVKVANAVHEVVTDAAVAATCTESGLTEGKHCSVCHTVLVAQEVIPAGHKADSVVFENIVEATRTAAGSYDSVVYCSVCRVELSRTTVNVPQILAESIKLASKPNKVEYKQGEALDVKGGKITIGYTDKSTEDFEILAGWVSGFDSQKVGEQKLTVTFESVSSTLTTTFNVTVSKEDDNTAIDEDAANTVNIYAYQNVIVVENANAEIYVYDAMGRLVERNLGNNARTEIRMNNAGVYIVKVGNVAKRVMIND